MSQSDELEICAEPTWASSQEHEPALDESQELAGAPEVNLEALAAEDEALWHSEHTSDDEVFDPEKPDDLTTATAKAEAENDESIGEETRSEDEDEDDSCVVDDDEVSYENLDHDFLVTFSRQLDNWLNLHLQPVSDKKDRKAALVEVLCDHYRCKQDSDE